MRASNCHCLVNPLIDREYELKVTEAEVKKNVFIAGGGVTGCEAAIVAAERGHKVTIFEKDDRLGGQWHIAALPPNKTEFLTFVQWQTKRLKDLGVTIHYNTELTIEIVKEAKPDEVIIATGSKPFIPPIKGVDKANVFQANDVLLQNCNPGKNVVVAGGGSVGVETAEYLAVYGSNVTIVEMREDILIGCERETALMLRKAIKEYGMNVYTNAKVCEIGDDTVNLERKGKEIMLEEVDTVVIAAGSKPFNVLQEPLEALGIKTRVIGDSLEVRNGLKDIYEGFMAGYEV
jgi:pyruvate/2-oxoglutarate dehydrogenase complex dihydrolipoamide dehydrogenase (E3) component